MSTTGWPLWLRIVVGVAAVLFLWWRISKRWDRASAYSDGMAAEEEEQKKWFEQSKADARVQEFKKEVKRRYPVAEESMASADSYIIKYIVFYDDKSKIVAPDDITAKFISFFIKGGDHIIVSKNLLTAEVSEVKINKMSFNLALPEWIKRKW